ncbi:LSU ribosomal protein L19e [Methanosarcina siciliae C2J]|uniref:Large ribosomal subunit protein eL19 n=3 Tax=Methanosarcina siciliae TaxID=38027 RepID=A0A0E3LBE2_9EURY|nr:50S ribosomal protein L19e [Methanosarcina siciliae]AKB29708.1 LSU ribosomal protein L19e [Methanosarcina siciliae T4/M]AKB33616.1 LSU ribosomal protein L19e [Methanosarcina siciliae HI350]AKB37995.1 LSU ribosomal protein L19e [Methanosarcina siciliae C2J]
MSDLFNQKKLASKVLGCGLDRVWLDPEASEEIASAITREDIRGLIEKGTIKVKPVKGVSRGRARALDAKRKYGHCKGYGSRKGKKGARTPKKEQWIKKIRALRRRLKELRADGALDKSVYCRLYRKAKGGEYRSVSHLNSHLESEKLLKKE